MWCRVPAFPHLRTDGINKPCMLFPAVQASESISTKATMSACDWSGVAQEMNPFAILELAVELTKKKNGVLLVASSA